MQFAQGKKGIQRFIGGIVAIVMLLALSFGVALLVNAGKISEENISIWMTLCSGLSCLAGCALYVGCDHKERSLYCLGISGGVFFLCLVFGMLIWSGAFENVLIRLGSTLAGGALGFSLGFIKMKKRW